MGRLSALSAFGSDDMLMALGCQAPSSPRRQSAASIASEGYLELPQHLPLI